MNYIDIHCHLNLPNFDDDRDEVIKRAKEKGIGMIVVGTDKETSGLALEIANNNENIWAIIGQHPADNIGEVFDYNYYLELAKNKKVIGIGETGFDYIKFDENLLNKQKEIFIKQIEIANTVNKPLMLHIRNGLNKTIDAYSDALEILKKYAKVKGNVHFFAGNLVQARKFIDLGFKLSFTGVITFARDYDEVIKNIPLNMLMVETDAPFVAPIPYRGKRNESVYIIEIANKIAEIRGENRDMVIEQLLSNSRNTFLI